MAEDISTHESVVSRIFKILVRPFYSRFSSKLFHDLRVQEINDLLLQINHRVFTVEEELERLKNIQSASNLMLSGLDTFDNPLYQKYKEAAFEVFDLAETLKHKKQESAEVVSFFEKAGVNITGKNVGIVGGGDSLYAHAAARKGAKNIFRIEATPLRSSEKSDNNVHYIYPLDLSHMDPQPADVFFIPDPNWVTLLISRNIAGLGAFIKNCLVISARVSNHTVFTSSIEPAIFDNDGRISLNDNYIRQQLHLNGFVEVCCVYTEGAHINNAFDSKVSKFNQLNGITIVKKNTKHAKDSKYNNQETTEKIYVAYKLPTRKNIA